MLVIIKRIISIFAILSALLLISLIVAVRSLEYISDFTAFMLGIALGGVFAFSIGGAVLIGLYEYIKDNKQIYEK